MPKLGVSNIVTINIPGYPAEDPAWVKLDTKVPIGMVMARQEGAASKTKATLEGLCEAIKEWNYTDENGQVAAINSENIAKLPSTDFAYIENYLTELVKGEAKSPLSTEEKKVSV